MTDWHDRFYRLALEVSTWSKDPSTKVGAVVVDDNRKVIGTGYNGFPKGLRDDERLVERPLKYPRVVHAEVNAVLSAASSGVYTRTSGSHKGRLHLYCTHIPCSSCAGILINYGITDVYYPVKSYTGGMSDSQNIAVEMLEEAGVKQWGLNVK